MSKQWDRNLLQISKGFPELYQRVYPDGLDTGIENDIVERIESLPTPSGQDALVIQLISGEIFRMNSMYDPVNEAKIWSEGNLPTASNIIMFGLGNGLFAKEIIRKCPKESRILIYEPSPRVFLYTLEHYDLTFCFSKPGLRVVVQEINDDMFGNVMEEMVTLENCQDYQFIMCPQMCKVFPKGRKWLVERYASDGIAKVKAERETIRWNLHIQPYNLLHNIQYLSKNTVVPNLAKVWESDIPVVIVGAGPSLKQEIAVLKRIRERAFVFAVDSALPYLLEHDIIPDAFFCAEADKPMQFFENSKVKEIPLFCKLGTTHKLLDIHTGGKIFGFEDGFSELLYKKYDIPRSTYRYGSNCATSLFSVSKELGAKTVILVGQDMVYGDSGESHVGARDEGDYLKGDIFTCINNEGKEVQTRCDWNSFLRWYENAILFCRFEHVVNTSLKGARIKGTEVMSLEEAIERYGKPHSDFDKLLKRAETIGDNSNFNLSVFYIECQRQLYEIKNMINGNPRNLKRTKFLIYEILKLYEIANEEDEFSLSQKEGIKKINKYLDMCIKEIEQ